MEAGELVEVHEDQGVGEVGPGLFRWWDYVLSVIFVRDTFSDKNAVSIWKYIGGTRIWDHAKMRGRGASKNGLERKPGLLAVW